MFVRRLSRLLKTGKPRAATVSPSVNVHPHRLASALFHSEGNRTIPYRMASSSSPSRPTERRNPNRLLESKSPYLLQHAYNPVNWYPWGEEAFRTAKEENKLIFLSVGYSTCHWCHVMEHESFENETIAALMNKDFVNVKVDREERPDVDRMYMTFIQAISGRGGWPMSVFMTPDLHPVFGGTYYPPDDRYYGQPGFATILKSLANQWKEDPARFKTSGEKIMEVLTRSASVGKEGDLPDASACSLKCYEQLRGSYEPVYGGFSDAPKFPQPVNLNLLLRLYVREGRDTEVGRQALDMCLHTLRMMAKGGINDHVSLGFARYSTDAKWHVPHFEKMLYDQAQLVNVYADAYLLTKDESFAQVVRDTITYIENCLSDPSGGFYSAEDADSYPEFGSKTKKEGAFCVWTYQEIQELLASSATPAPGVSVADIVCHHFDIRPQGNVDPYQDPHDELKGRNVLIVRGSNEETAAKFGLTLDVFRGILKEALLTLKNARERRPKPHLDDKMLAAWNGLMISALAKAGTVLGEEIYIERAKKTARFLRTHLYNAEHGKLLRSCYRGDAESVTQNAHPIDGFLDDYAFTIRGLLDLYTACQDETWLEWADELQQRQDELFWDASEGGYFTSATGDVTVLIRLKEDQDGAEPSGNSVAVSNLVLLSALVDRADYRDKAARVLRLFSQRLTKFPVSLPAMVSACQLYQDSPVEVIIVGSHSSKETKQLWEAVLTHPAHSLLGLTVVLFDPDKVNGSFLARRRPMLATMKPAAAYVCRHRSCSAPVSSADELRQLLDVTE